MIPSGLRPGLLLQPALPIPTAKQQLRLLPLSLVRLRLEAPWCYKNTYFNTPRLLRLLSSPKNVLSAEKSSAAVSLATNLELHNWKHKQNRTWKQRIEHWHPTSFKPEGTRVQNREQLHSLRKHLTQCGGKGPLRPNICKKQLNRGTELRLVGHCCIRDEEAGAEAERIPGCSGAAVLTASRLRLCSPTSSFLMAE